MWITSREGRKAYLEFLRNLAAQAVLFSFFLILSYKASAVSDGGVFPWREIVLASILFLMLVYSIICNCSLLMYGVSESKADIGEYRLQLVNEGRASPMIVLGVLAYCYHKHLSMFFEVAFILLVVALGTTVALALGVYAAGQMFLATG